MGEAGVYEVIIITIIISIIIIITIIIRWRVRARGKATLPTIRETTQPLYSQVTSHFLSLFLEDSFHFDVDYVDIMHHTEISQSGRS